MTMNHLSSLKHNHLVHAVAAAVMVLALAGCGDDSSVPVASAGAAQTVTSGAMITLDATGSTDDDGDALTYSWTLTSKPAGSAATITGANAAKPTFTADLPGTYVASVVVSDGANTSQPASVTVTASDSLGFDSTPVPIAQSYPSYSFDAYAIKSIGDQVTLKAGSPHTLAAFELVMMSWACENGDWTGGCSSTPGTSFQHPITVNFYNNAGALLATRTQTFTIPFRPSPDATCGDPLQWRTASGVCAYGTSFKIAFDLRSLRAQVPDSFYYEVTVNTRYGGPAPTGTPGKYNGINIAVYNALTTAPTTGTDPKPGILRWDGEDSVEDAGLMSRLVMAAP